MSKPRVLAEPILVGRDKELEKLRYFLNLASEGKGKTVFVSAEAGVGKTRLLHEFLNSQKQSKKTVILSGWSLFNAGLPYFPFIEAFSTYYSALGEKGEKEESELNSWLKGPAKAELSGKLQYLSPQALKDQTFASVAKTIHSIASQNRVILALEDIHWADSASLVLLQYLARVIKDTERVLLLATFRREELTNDSEGYPHPLVETLSMMKREDLFDEISLPNLTFSCIAKMAESMLGGALQQEFAEKLWIESEGNPLFVVESLRMLHERNNIVQENTKWRLVSKELEIPSKIKDIIIHRLSCLNQSERRVLDVASVIGEEFEAGLLSAVAEEDSLDVLETLNVIAHSTSLVHADENRYRFDHARSREIIYDSLAQPLKQGYHKKIAEKLENSISKKLSFADLAFHYSQAGNKTKSIKYSMLAAENELTTGSNAEAIKHFHYVLQNIPKGNSVERTTALEGLGDAYASSSKFGQAIEMYDQLANLTIGVTKLRAYRKAMEYAIDREGHSKLWIKYGRKALEIGDVDRLEMARVIMRGGKAYRRSLSDPMIIADEFDEALRIFEEENSIADVADVLRRKGAILSGFMCVDLPEIAGLLRSVAIYMELGNIRKEIGARLDLGMIFQCNGLFSEAAREFSIVLRIDQKLGVYAELASAECQMGFLCFAEGKITEALSHSWRALDCAKKVDSTQLAINANALFCQIYSFMGDLSRADKYFEMISKLPAGAFEHEENLPAGLILRALTVRGMYFAAKELWQESNLTFAKALEKNLLPGIEILIRSRYAWALQKQGYLEAAKTQMDKVQRIQTEVDEKFGCSNIELYVMVPRKVMPREEFDLRFDLVNIGKRTGLLVRIECALFSEFSIINHPAFCKPQNGNLHFKEKRLGPFQVETLKLKLRLDKTGSYCLNPRLLYEDNFGNEKSFSTNPITIIAESAKTSSFEGTTERFSEIAEQKLTFRSEATQKTINFLASAFEEDYIKRRLPEEKSGWRTLMNVVKKAQVSKHCIYGRSGRGGKVLSELKSSGLLEMRVFQGEVGRGGHIVKIRFFRKNKDPDQSSKNSG